MRMIADASRATRRIVLALAVVASGALVGWQLLERWDPPELLLVDQRAELAKLLEDQEHAPPLPSAGEDHSAEQVELVQWPLDEETARVFFPSIGNGRYVFAPQLYMRPASNLASWQRLDEHPGGGWTVKTNSLGMRDDQEPSSIQPDLRILICGASNVEGMCSNAESAANLLETRLAEQRPARRVETLNAGVGANNFYGYLRVLKHYRWLRPDVFVLIAYGGTDFGNCLALERFYQRRPPWPEASKSYVPLRQSRNSFVRQLRGTELGQAAHFASYPEDLEISLGVARRVCQIAHTLCRDAGIRFVAVYLPPPLTGQPHLLAREREEALQLIGLTDAELATSDRLADEWLAALAELGIEQIDLRPIWRASAERLYWTTDTHINLAGQAALAQALLERIVDR